MLVDISRICPAEMLLQLCDCDAVSVLSLEESLKVDQKWREYLCNMCGFCDDIEVDAWFRRESAVSRLLDIMMEGPCDRYLATRTSAEASLSTELFRQFMYQLC